MTNPITIRSNKRRVIDALRDHFGGTWEYIASEHVWMHREEGWWVRAVSQLHWGEDEGGYTEYWTSKDVQLYGLSKGYW